MMGKLRIDCARAVIDALRAHYGKGKTKLTDEQIAEGLEHYSPKAKVDIVMVDELRGVEREEDGEAGKVLETYER